MFPSQHAGLLLGGAVGFPFWALETLAAVHRENVTGSHGFGHRHPRARHLTLLVTVTEECACGELAAWRENFETVFCGRCADVEGALAEARRLAVTS